MGRANKHERTLKEKDLALTEEVRALGLKENRSGCLLSTSLSLSLASTSWVDRVNLYGFNKNGIDPSSS